METDSTRYPPCRSVLEESFLFGCLDQPVLEQILSDARHETWRRGRTQPSSQISDRAYIVISGRVRLSRSNPETGRAVTVFLLGRGDVFDMINLLEGQPMPEVEISAMADVVLLSDSILHVREWIAEHADFNRRFLPYLGRQMAQLSELVSDLALYDTETRLARLILRHLDPRDTGGEVHLLRDFSHATLAEMIGTVRVVVNRQLQHWRREGIINTERGQLMVRRLEGLIEKTQPLLRSAR